MQEKIAQGKALATKATAAYATYKSAKKTVQQAADLFCHQWEIDLDYTYDLYQTAQDVVKKSVVNLPGQRRKTTERHDARFRSDNWAFIKVPGITGPLQAKTWGSSMIFRSLRQADLDALRAYIKELSEVVEDELTFEPEAIRAKTDIMAWTEDCWDYRKSRNSRSFKSVFLPAELQADIEADLKSFTESRERLQRLELPWRRGYLLSGPPGTGKTSLSLAIAGSLGFSLASLSLTDIKSDGMLRQAVSQLRKNTVLVIEDIDAYSVSHDRNHNAARDGALSLSGLLNSLDGFETPDGLVTIATTNHIEHLDAALIRSGRLDRTFTLDYIAGPELERLFTWFYELEPLSPAPANTKQAQIAPAEVTEVFKQHLEDAAAGWVAVLDLIESKTTNVHTIRTLVEEVAA